MQLLEADRQTAETRSLCPALPADAASPLPGPSATVSSCPICGREDALLVIGEVTYCAACGYASDGARGCT